MTFLAESVPDLELFGKADTQLITLGQHRIHHSLYAPLNEMAFHAASQGHRLTIVSAWRSFERQCVLWNAKANGERPILDDEGRIIRRQDLDDEEAMWAILRWSALPGASRHHWGTDIDVIDGAALKPGVNCQLTREETEAGGVFEAFHRWLDSYLVTENTLFFRPYSRVDWGIAPEPWHLSYAPVSMTYQKALTIDLLRACVQCSEIQLKDCVLRHLEEIYVNFVMVDWTLYPQAGDRSC